MNELLIKGLTNVSSGDSAKIKNFEAEIEDYKTKVAYWEKMNDNNLKSVDRLRNLTVEVEDLKNRNIYWEKMNDNNVKEIERLKNKISYDANNFEDLIEKEKEKINSNFQSDMYELKKKHNGEIKRISINITII